MLSSLYTHFDVPLFTAIHGSALQHPFFGVLSVLFATYVPYAVAVAVVVIVFWPGSRRAERRIAVITSVVAALAARYIVKEAITILFPRARPFVTLANVHPLITVSPSEYLQSFPSGHTIFFFALAAALYGFNKKVGAWTFLLAALISIARVCVGVHYPTDIIVGALLGTATGAIIYYWYRHHADLVNRLILRGFAFLRL